jgi:hypothetical protein
MSSAAQIVANRENSQLSTGPRTAEGKAQSSHNAVATGLFTTSDFVRPDERAEYAATRAALWSEITPEGVIEGTFASAILNATWRLRRCGLVEAALAETSLLDPMAADPANEDRAARIQISIDRARTQAHALLRRSLADLRRLQTDKAIRDEILSSLPAAAPPPDPDLTSYKEVLAASHQLDRSRLDAKRLDRVMLNSELASFCNPRAA